MDVELDNFRAQFIATIGTEGTKTGIPLQEAISNFKKDWSVTVDDYVDKLKCCDLLELLCKINDVIEIRNGRVFPVVNNANRHVFQLIDKTKKRKKVRRSEKFQHSHMAYRSSKVNTARQNHYNFFRPAPQKILACSNRSNTNIHVVQKKKNVIWETVDVKPTTLSKKKLSVEHTAELLPSNFSNVHFASNSKTKTNLNKTHLPPLLQKNGDSTKCDAPLSSPSTIRCTVVNNNEALLHQRISEPEVNQVHSIYVSSFSKRGSSGERNFKVPSSAVCPTADNDNGKMTHQLKTVKGTKIDQGYFLRLCQSYLPTEGTLLPRRQPFTKDVKVLLPSEKELKLLPFRPRPIISLMKDLPAQKTQVSKEMHVPEGPCVDIQPVQKSLGQLQIPAKKCSLLRYHPATILTQDQLKKNLACEPQLSKEKIMIAHTIVPHCHESVKMEKPQLIDVNRCIAKIHRSQCPGHEYFNAAYVTHLVDQNIDHLIKKICFTRN